MGNFFSSKNPHKVGFPDRANSIDKEAMNSPMTVLSVSESNPRRSFRRKYVKATRVGDVSTSANGTELSSPNIEDKKEEDVKLIQAEQTSSIPIQIPPARKNEFDSLRTAASGVNDMIRRFELRRSKRLEIAGNTKTHPLRILLLTMDNPLAKMAIASADDKIQTAIAKDPMDIATPDSFKGLTALASILENFGYKGDQLTALRLGLGIRRSSVFTYDNLIGRLCNASPLILQGLAKAMIIRIQYRITERLPPISSDAFFLQIRGDDEREDGEIGLDTGELLVNTNLHFIVEPIRFRDINAIEWWNNFVTNYIVA